MYELVGRPNNVTCEPSALLAGGRSRPLHPSPGAHERRGAHVPAIALGERYRIEGELGAGGNATVYLAHDLKHDRKVAVKVLKPELGAERFLTEIRTTANVQHRTSLPCSTPGRWEGTVCYVMPFVGGESLRDGL